jgi:predicted  nucleic acid-binding Zn-ribbon protein
MPDVLLGLSIAQISISIICIVAFLLYNRKDELNEGSKIEDVDDDSEALQAQSRIIATNTKRASRYKKNIANAQEELVNIRDKLEQGKIKQSDKTKYLADQERLLNEIKTYTSNLNSIGSVDSGEISSKSSS